MLYLALWLTRCCVAGDDIGRSADERRRQPQESFAYWSGYTPSRTVAGRQQPLSAVQLRAEAERLRVGAERSELGGDSAKAAHLREAAAEMDRRASALDEERSSESDQGDCSLNSSHASQQTSVARERAFQRRSALGSARAETKPLME